MEYQTLKEAVEQSIENGLISTNTTATELLHKQESLKQVIEKAISRENSLVRRF